MPWVKAFHVVFMVSWMAGIFYLPRLFVYHAMCPDDDQLGRERFKTMERKLYRGIMTPAMVLTLVFGTWLLVGYGMEFVKTNGWLHAKLVIVTLLVAYHFHAGQTVKRFASDENIRSHVFFRFYNELPVFFLIGIVVLVIVKPF